MERGFAKFQMEIYNLFKYNTKNILKSACRKMNVLIKTK